MFQVLKSVPVIFRNNRCFFPHWDVERINKIRILGHTEIMVMWSMKQPRIEQYKMGYFP